MNPRHKPAGDDNDADLAIIQRTVHAGSAGRPVTTAPNSVFDAARKAQAAARIPPLAAHHIQIHQGRPKPIARGCVTSAYRAVIQQMQPTDSVELPGKQARGFYSAAKVYGKAASPPQEFSFRKLSDDIAAVWRDI